MTKAAASRRPGRRPGELFELELPHGDARARPARSPAAWLAALDRDLGASTPSARRLAEHYAGRAERRGERWVVMLGDHRARRAFRRLREVDLGKVACAQAAALLSAAEARALLAAGLTPAELQPLCDPAVDCSTLGVIRMRSALDRLVELGHAAVRVDGRTASGVISIPNTWA